MRPNMLELVDVCSGYGAAQILFNVSFQVAAGEVVAVLGRNGAGKSTTLKTIAGLVRATSGEIRYQSKRIERLAAYRIARAGLGYVPEERRIFTELTVAENLDVGHRDALDRRSAREPWTIDRALALFPALAPLMHRAGGQISGGEQQMLTIARTLMGNPTLLLLDEPGEGLAPIVVQRMLAALETLKAEGLAMLVSEQNPMFAQTLADRVLIVESGVVRYAASVAAFNRDPDVRSRYLAL
jgi:branched-chain amino acid transport system ATP-binding protein